MKWDERSISQIPMFERRTLVQQHVEDICELLHSDPVKSSLVEALISGVLADGVAVPVERYVKIRDSAHELALKAAFEDAKRADGSFDWERAGQRMDESAIWVFEECEARGWTPR
ncbi:hypothetical protein BWO91_17705 [Plantibacter flavus]|uniref:hypothetical protein n=1 Tax=Plantibacter flavus TaxID=150123 RepID=UPI00099CD1E5|nr:hypothetical protein [Plantibacter flavus]AQX81556.1 hypothetical protein BWO91_17705 [Plantibacter flavus]